MARLVAREESGEQNKYQGAARDEGQADAALIGHRGEGLGLFQIGDDRNPALYDRRVASQDLSAAMVDVLRAALLPA
jgi:hypothetical protein